MEPIISIKEARKLLGVESRDMSDDQVLEVIIFFQKLANNLLDQSSGLLSS